MRIASLGLGVAWVACAALIGCTSASSTRTMEMEQRRFAPGTIDIDEGATLVWHNTSTERHHVQSIGSSPGVRIDSGPLDAGQVYEYQFDGSGVFVVGCRIHEADGMVAVVRVG